jgi:hypothetical protein
MWHRFNHATSSDRAIDFKDVGRRGAIVGKSYALSSRWRKRGVVQQASRSTVIFSPERQLALLRETAHEFA